MVLAKGVICFLQTIILICQWKSFIFFSSVKSVSDSHLFICKVPAPVWMQNSESIEGPANNTWQYGFIHPNVLCILLSPFIQHWVYIEY